MPRGQSCQEIRSRFATSREARASSAPRYVRQGLQPPKLQSRFPNHQPREYIASHRQFLSIDRKYVSAWFFCFPPPRLHPAQFINLHVFPGHPETVIFSCAIRPTGIASWDQLLQRSSTNIKSPLCAHVCTSSFSFSLTSVPHHMPSHF